MRRRTTAAVALVAVLAWAGNALPWDRVTTTTLVTSPAAYDDRDVVVTGVVGTQQWVNVTVLGNPPVQAWFPAFLLADGVAGIWVVVRVGTVPPQGARIDVYGRFWAVSQSVEMQRPYVVLP